MDFLYVIENSLQRMKSKVHYNQGRAVNKVLLASRTTFQYPHLTYL